MFRGNITLNLFVWVLENLGCLLMGFVRWDFRLWRAIFGISDLDYLFYEVQVSGEKSRAGGNIGRGYLWTEFGVLEGLGGYGVA